MFNNIRAGYSQIETGVTSQRLRNGYENDVCFTIYGYEVNKIRTILYHMFSILLLGVPYLICFWYPNIKVIKYQKCPLRYASIILISENFKNYSIIKTVTEILGIPSMGALELRHFTYQHTKYVWLEHNDCFGTLDELMPAVTLSEILNTSCGLVELEEQRLYAGTDRKIIVVLFFIHFSLRLYGPNKIEVEVKSYWKLFVEEVFNPYYIFQAFSILLWCFDQYLIYAGCIFILTVFSAIAALLETRKQNQAIHDLVETSTSGNVAILRRHLMINNAECMVNPSELVPGTLLVIPRTGCVMPCDAVLIEGNCIVNESMLTGESIPVTKTPPHESSEVYDPLIHKRHTLFSGTHVLQARFYEGNYVLARAVRTGFNTTKGALIKSILYPAPLGLKFYKDCLKFVLFLFCIAAAGMCYSLLLYLHRRADVKDIIIRTLDIITIVVPPALPAAMTVAIVSSQSRLKRLNIFCISPPRINVCGKIKLACFDKTGTLTHEGLDLYSVIPSENSNFSPAISDPKLLDVRHPLLQAMVTCHSLTRINGVLTGDPLDLNMFESTDWMLEEPGLQESTRFDMLAPTVVMPKTSHSYLNIAGGDSQMPYQIGIIKIFAFSSSLQCMSVIIRELDASHMVAFTKGAPEKIGSLCKPDTLPSDFSKCLSAYTASGYRVIAMAYKKLPSKTKWTKVQKIRRDEIESELNFLGFLVLQNTLKPETTPVVTLLQSAHIRTVMITGDNVETAISVARDCGMVRVFDRVTLIKIEPDREDGSVPGIIFENIGAEESSHYGVINLDNDNCHFAMDGRTWSRLRVFYQDILPLLLLRTTVFARFQPEQKTQVVIEMQKLDYIVCMVGDGANDCGALKAAHVGVSLSQTESSVAAPFTSTVDNISCVIHLMLEGRCALVTSFAEIKYMAAYSIIQFFTILILYRNHSILGDTQFLFIDLIITTSFALAISRQGPSNKLVSKKPMGSLVSAINLVPLLLQIFLCGFVQLASLYYLIQQPWFEAVPPVKDEVILCWENTVLFIVSCFQYIIMAVLYSKGKPFRQTVVTNFWLLISTLTLISFVTYLCICPSKWIAEFFQIYYLPYKHNHMQRVFRYTLLLFPIVHFFIALCIEVCVAETKWLKCIIHFMTRKRKPKNKYKLLTKENQLEYLLSFENGESSIITLSSSFRS